MSKKLCTFISCILFIYSCKSTTGIRKEIGYDNGNDDDIYMNDEYVQDVPNYMLTLQQAKAVILSKAYVSPSGISREPQTNITNEYSGFSNFTENLINEFMNSGTVPHKRRFDVNVYNDDLVNASMDMWQRLLVYKGSVRKVNADGLLDAICHEMGHSVTNNAYEVYELQQAKVNSMGIVTEILYYLAQAAPDRKCVQENGVVYCPYTHNSSAYQTLLNRWKNDSQELSYYLMRNEATTDFLGGVLCSKMGVEIDKLGIFHEGGVDTGVLSYYGDELQNGATYKVESAYLFSTLFPYNTHPPSSERVKQFRRLRSIFQTHHNSSATYAKRWKDNYASLGGCSSCSPFASLTYLRSESEFLTITSEDGFSKKIPKMPLERMNKYLPKRKQ